MPETEHPIATEVIFESDDVRVWNQVVRAGESIPRHRHDNDYFLVNITGEGPIRVQFYSEDGAPRGSSFEFRPKPGSADFVERGHIETAENLGEDYHAILVELKKQD